MLEDIIGYLKTNDVEYKKNYQLSQISSIRIGGKAKIVAYPSDETKLLELVVFLENIKYRYIVLGRMSNVLPRDDGYEGIVIRTDRLTGFSIKNNKLAFECGNSVPMIASKTVALGLSGFEEISGIPGSLGGAIYGNAGAFGREIGQLISSVRFYDITKNKIFNVSSDECCFGYRNSMFTTIKALILSAELNLAVSSAKDVREAMNKYRSLRVQTQPVGTPSLGSTFKRVSGVSAGQMIDDCGLKGYSIGGAQISHKHAGFIINTGAATAAEYIRLAEYASKRVCERFKIDLELEVEIL